MNETKVREIVAEELKNRIADPYLEVKEAMEYARCSREVVYSGLRSGALQSVRIGVKWLTRRTWIDQWLASE